MMQIYEQLFQYAVKFDYEYKSIEERLQIDRLSLYYRKIFILFAINTKPMLHIFLVLRT